MSEKFFKVGNLYFPYKWHGTKEDRKKSSISNGNYFNWTVSWSEDE